MKNHVRYWPIADIEISDGEPLLALQFPVVAAPWEMYGFSGSGKFDLDAAGIAVITACAVVHRLVHHCNMTNRARFNCISFAHVSLSISRKILTKIAVPGIAENQIVLVEYVTPRPVRFRG